MIYFLILGLVIGGGLFYGTNYFIRLSNEALWQRRQIMNEKYRRLLATKSLRAEDYPLVHVNWHIERDSYWDENHIWIVERDINISMHCTLTLAPNAIIIFYDHSVGNVVGTKPHYSKFNLYCENRKWVAKLIKGEGANLLSHNGLDVIIDQCINKLSGYHSYACKCWQCNHCKASSCLVCCSN